MENNKMITKKDNENGIKIIEYDGFTFVNLCDIEQMSNKLNYIENNKQLFDIYNGFVLEENVDVNQFFNGDYLKQVYLLNGMLILDKLTVSNLHGMVSSILNYMIQKYGLSNGRVVSCAGSASITINQNTCQQPDGQLFRVPKLPLIPNLYKILAFEVNIKTLPTSLAIKKLIRYFGVSKINVVFLFEIFERDPIEGGNFKAVVSVFERNISINNPSSIISFGTEPLSANDIDTYKSLSNNTPITGHLYNNMNINNHENNPMFMVTINPETLFFNTPLPVGCAPLVIDLFIVKQTIDILNNFSFIF